MQLDLHLVMNDNFRTDMGWDSLIADDGTVIHLCVSAIHNILMKWFCFFFFGCELLLLLDLPFHGFFFFFVLRFCFGERAEKPDSTPPKIRCYNERHMHSVVLFIGKCGGAAHMNVFIRIKFIAISCSQNTERVESTRVCKIYGKIK